MTTRDFNVFQSHTGQRQKIDAHPNEDLIIDEQPAFWQQSMHIGHAAIGGVFHWQHREFGCTGAYSGDHIFKCWAWQGGMLGPCSDAGLV